MSEAFQFDVFLSHSAKDKAVVRPLAERLRAAELETLQAEADALKRLQAKTAAELVALSPAPNVRVFKGEL